MTTAPRDQPQRAKAWTARTPSLERLDDVHFALGYGRMAKGWQKVSRWENGLNFPELPTRYAMGRLHSIPGSGPSRSAGWWSAGVARTQQPAADGVGGVRVVAAPDDGFRRGGQPFRPRVRRCAQPGTGLGRGTSGRRRPAVGGQSGRAGWCGGQRARVTVMGWSGPLLRVSVSAACSVGSMVRPHLVLSAIQSVAYGQR
jgi:hypothetical protein